MIDALVKLIDQNFQKATGENADIKGSSGIGAKSLRKLKAEKLFEIVALCELLTRMAKDGSPCNFVLMHGGSPGRKLVLQSAPGFADPGKSYIRVLKGGGDVATVWTNVEVNGISAGKIFGAPASGSYHEADILVLNPDAHSMGVAIRPNYSHVYLVIECKYLGMLPKAALRNLLGLRRELSFVQKRADSRLGTSFGTSLSEFRSRLPAHPSSHLIFCCPDHYGFDPNSEWIGPAETFGIEFWPLKRIPKKAS